MASVGASSSLSPSSVSSLSSADSSLWPLHDLSQLLCLCAGDVEAVKSTPVTRFLGDAVDADWLLLIRASEALPPSGSGCESRFGGVRDDIVGREWEE